jgi:hypothetical protein
MTLNRRDILTGTVAAVVATGSAGTTEAAASAQMTVPPRGLDPDLDIQLFGNIERLADRLQTMRVYLEKASRHSRSTEDGRRGREWDLWVVRREIDHAYAILSYASMTTRAALAELQEKPEDRPFA